MNNYIESIECEEYYSLAEIECEEYYSLAEIEIDVHAQNTLDYVINFFKYLEVLENTCHHLTVG